MPKYKKVEDQNELSEKMEKVGLTTKESKKSLKYKYVCECGHKCTYETDEKPLKRLVKCWHCGVQMDLSDEKK